MDTVESEQSLPSCEARCQRMTPQGLCDWCYRRLGRDMGELAELHTRVSADLAPGSSTTEHVSGSKEPPVPVRLSALSWIGPAAPGRPGDPDAGVWPDHRGDQTGPVPLLGVLGIWARMVAEDTGFRPLRWETGHLLWWLGQHLEWTAAQPWADDFAAEMHDQVLIGRGLAGGRLEAPPKEVRVKKECPRCDRMTVYRRPGEDQVECVPARGGCGRLWREDDWTAATKARETAA